MLEVVRTARRVHFIPVNNNGEWGQGGVVVGSLLL